MNLQYFSDQDFYFSIKKFFKDLNIPVHYMTEQPTAAKEIISNTFKPKNPAHQMIEDVYFLGMVDDRGFNNQPSVIDDKQLKKEDYDGLLVFGITLDRQDGKLPTRGQMAEVSRAFNREFHYTPVVIVFKYDRYISFSNCERIPYKQEWREGEKAGKVSLLMDIDTVNTHTGHLKILQTLAIPTSGKKAVTTFDGLYNYWQEVFSVALLSKRFYQELSNWYFWALEHIEFPEDAEKDREVRNATSVIRLITRLMFVWFLKEKKLVPDALFDKNDLDEHLNYKDYHDSTYYKAILQNLFFATLNTKMKKDDPKSRKFVHRQYGVQEFYRYERFFKNKKKALKIFEDIPFLNGGLFENLDKNIGKPDEVRTDCFSNRPVHEKRLKVPDFLFFGAEDQIDLSKVYGSKKRKNETVRGIVHLLKSYKFTIAENTPIEEEIALDPELLGKVFENLLASYNPETKTTARKQTGSFYTPREIVNYMVDESLIAYLEGKLIDLYEKESGFVQKTPPFQKKLIGKQKPVQSKIAPSKSKITAKVKKEINDKLRHLLSYSAEDHLFSKKEVKALIDALDSSKILDPACGSGAFPMGILHKMVHILSKLDPQNTQWKQRQIKNQTRQIKQDISYAEKINDNKARQKALDELAERMATINNAFDTNELDFGRKLYLIENCIFGVDIQPIAVQIAKLRFFISLIVDQIVDENKENLGIIPLPNLETKFVAANTLIGVEKGLGNLFEQKIKEKEKELAKVRQRHFSARTPNTKTKYREKDEQLRSELARLLIESGDFGTGVAEQLAQWDPYDQNTSADFFDMEWMFGVRDGFDVVIGNPPYVRADSGEQHLALRKAIEESEQYETLWEKWDLYIPFIERGYKVLNPRGVTTMIVSDAFCHSKYAQKSQEWFLKNSRVLRLDFFSKIKIFDASVHNITYLFQKADGSRHKPERRVHDPEFGAVKILPSSEQSELDYRAFFPQDASVLDFTVPTLRLEEICYISVGMVVNAHEKLAPGAFKLKDLISYQKDRLHPKPFVEGKDLQKWLLTTHKFIEWNTERAPTLFRRKTFVELYEHDEKLMLPMVGEIRAAIDKQRFYCNHGIFVTVPWHKLAGIRNKSLKKAAHYRDQKSSRPNLPKREKLEKNSRRFDIKYLLAILNSSTVCNFLRANRRNNIQLYPDDWKKVLVPATSPNKQVAIVKLVDEILAAMREGLTTNIDSLEAKIDAHVSHLYKLTEEEYSLVLKETNCPDPFRVAALNVYRDIARGKMK